MAAAGVTAPPSLSWIAGQRERAANAPREDAMIFIAAKFQVKPAYADQWPRITAEFTAATRSEPGCLWFDWSRGLEDPAEYVLIEAFRDGDAGAAHVNSDHFEKARQTLPPYLVRTPRIVNFEVPQDDWSLLGELAVPGPE